MFLNKVNHRKLTEYFKVFKRAGFLIILIKRLFLDTLSFMKIYLFNRSSTGNVSYNYSVKNPEEIMKHADLTKPYVLYVHGFGENLGFDSVRKTVSCK